VGGESQNLPGLYADDPCFGKQIAKQKVLTIFTAELMTKVATTPYPWAELSAFLAVEPGKRCG
jgi:hypothetical protein